MGEIILETKKVSRRFGGVVAVNEITLNVQKGEIFGLIGPNGAGKTTLLNMFSGLLKPTDGSILFQGEHIENLPAYKVTRRGIARTYQNIRLFRSMSLLENCIVGRHSVTSATFLESLFWLPRPRREERESKDKAYQLLQQVGLADRALNRADNLSYGDQRRLELVRALATNPELLLLDEPAAGMNDLERKTLQELLFKLRDEGLTILLIEHDMSLVMNTCDRLAVLNFGTLLKSGTPHLIKEDPEVIAAYLGTE